MSNIISVILRIDKNKVIDSDKNSHTDMELKVETTSIATISYPKN